jgi:hypothetical protein
MEPFRINFNGEPNWGTRQTAIVNRYADLLFSTYIQLELPTNDNSGVAGQRALWNHGSLDTPVTLFNGQQASPLGFNFIDRVELDIGGQIIDRLYSEYMYLWSVLTSDYLKLSKLSAMLSTQGYNVGGNLAFAANPGCTVPNGRQSLPNVLYIPLTFFFTKNPGTALPLIALQYHEVKINVIWKTPQEITGNFKATGNNPGAVGNLPQATSAALYIDYIYLDTDERRRFAQQSHEYLIEQVQFNEDVGISSASKRIDLTFNHPVKELLWVVQPTCYTNCKATENNYRLIAANRLTPFVYNIPAVFEQHLQINGQDRLEKRYGDYFNKVQPYQHHTGISAGPGVYMYSFAVKPEEHQPSGTCNFSRIDTATLVVTMDGAVQVDQGQGDVWDMRMYAVNYNVLRIMSGMGGLAFSN